MSQLVSHRTERWLPLFSGPEYKFALTYPWLKVKQFPYLEFRMVLNSLNEHGSLSSSQSKMVSSALCPNSIISSLVISTCFPIFARSLGCVRRSNSVHSLVCLKTSWASTGPGCLSNHHIKSRLSRLSIDSKQILHNKENRAYVALRVRQRFDSSGFRISHFGPFQVQIHSNNGSKPRWNGLLGFFKFLTVGYIRYVPMIELKPHLHLCYSKNSLFLEKYAQKLKVIFFFF